MDPGTGPVAEVEQLGEVEHLGDEPVRLPRLREAASDLRRGSGTVKHPRVWWTLAAVALVATTGLVVDGNVRSSEEAKVGSCENQLRVATGLAERRLGLLTNYLEPTLSPSGRVQELHLADLMSARAGQVLPRVLRADRVCRGVSVSPWHFSLVQRQSAASAYSAALTAVVQTVAAQGSLAFSDDASLQRLGDQLGLADG